MYLIQKKTILLLSIVLICLFSFLGCSRQAVNQNNFNSPKVIDKINLLSSEVKKEIEEKYEFPDDIFVLVRTINHLDQNKIGSFATEAMEKEAYWEQVRPKGFWARWIKRDNPWSTGVYILVSKEPNLIQIRYGERIRLEAYRFGLAIGDKYSQIQQQFKISGPNLGTLNTIQELSKDLPLTLDLPWYLRFGKSLVAITFSDFEELVSPSDGFYTNWLFKPYLKFIEMLGGFSSVGYFLLSNFVLYCCIHILFVQAIVTIILRKKERASIVSWQNLLSAIITTVFAVPFFGGVIMLTSGRFEDYLALQELGISLPTGTFLNVSWFANVTNFWLAAFITLANYINLLIKDPLGDKVIFYKHFGTYNGMNSATMDRMLFEPSEPVCSYRIVPAELVDKNLQAKLDDNTYVFMYDEYLYRPRFGMLIFLLFMPAAIGLVGLIREFFYLAINVVEMLCCSDSPEEELQNERTISSDSN